MSKKSGTKSIIANFGLLSSPLPEDAHADDRLAVPPRVVSSVGAGVIGATQRSLAEIREERDRLLAQVERGGSTLELDPVQVDPSPFPDRLGDDTQDEFEAFKRRFSEEGQKVPILVRSHPDLDGRYQVVFGHRRLRAARELGLAIRANVTELSDVDLVIHQGIENSARQDLTWIERSLFAWRMDRQGIKPREIKAALSIDDAELARLRMVSRAVPLDILEGIGRAPRVGRPRWVAFAAALSEKPAAIDRVRETLSADKVSSSDVRFSAALKAASAGGGGGQEVEEWGMAIDGGAAVVGKVSIRGNKVQMTLAKGHADAFTEFLRGELPELLEKYASLEGGPKE